MIFFVFLEKIAPFVMITPEELLHYVWKFRLYDASDLKTDRGEKLEIIDVGMPNTDAGPDFFNAKITIDDKKWAGNVEIHRTSDEWFRHKHDSDTAYNSVILHVVEKITRPIYNQKGQEIPQMALLVPEKVTRNWEYLMHNSRKIACFDTIASIPKISVNSWINALALERLERKTHDIYRHLERYNNSWEETLYVLLARNFGFGLNSDEFERLALSLPLNYIKKHSDNLFQIEALFFGQAGMLESDMAHDAYFEALQQEYHFLSHKFQLKPLTHIHFKSLRVRPQGFPQVRIAELAALMQQSEGLFTQILEKENYETIRMLFQADASEYWQTHFTFGKPTSKNTKFLGDNSLNTLLINTVAPILFAYGKKTGESKYCDRALHILESVKAERNRIVTDFKEAGITAKNAFDTQALIQLYNEYCRTRKCLYCRIGHTFLSRH